MSSATRRVLIPVALAGVIVVGAAIILISRQGGAPVCGAFAASIDKPAVLAGSVDVALAGAVPELRFDSETLTEADLSAEANAQVLSAVNALPVNLHTHGPIFKFKRCGESAVPVQLNLSAPDPSFDAYAWDGAQWIWLGGSTDQVTVDLPDVPQIVAWVESVPTAPIIGTEPDPRTAGLAPEYNGIITELYAPGLSVTANGTLSGTVPAAPEPGSPYAVYPVIGGTDLQSLQAMLGSEAARKSHVNALVSLATGSSFAGIAIDFRGLAAQWSEPYAALIEELASALHAKGKSLIVTQPLDAQTNDLLLQRIGRVADVIQVDLGIKTSDYLPGGAVGDGLKSMAQQVARYRLQPVLSASSLSMAGGKESPIAFRSAVLALGGTSTTISATTGTSITLALNPSSRLSFDPASGTYAYVVSPDSGYSVYTAATLATKLNALAALRLRGAVIRDIQGPDAVPNLFEPIKAYRQQSAVTGSNELNVAWSVKASDGSSVLTETRPLANADLVWTPDRDGTFTVQAAIASVSRDVAIVTVGKGTPTGTTAIGGDTDTSPDTNCFNATYVADVSVPDNTHFDKGQDFTKTWKVRNTGTCAWTPDTELVFASGSKMGAASPVKVGSLEVGKTVDVSVPMKSGDKDGTFTGYWQMRTQTQVFGDQLSVVIKVGAEVAAPPPVVPPSGGGKTEYGIHAHFYGYSDTAAGSQSIVGYVNELGLGWVKIQFRWGEYDYYCGGADLGVLDTMVNTANAAGLQVLLSVTTSPPCTHPWTDDVHAPPDDPQALVKAMEVLAGYYKGRVSAIEVWNEPNISAEWKSNPQKIDAARYTQFLAASYNAIKAQAPNMLVISAALAPTGWNDGVNAMDDFAYLQQMVAAGATKYMDCVGVHVNALRVPPSASLGGEYDKLFSPPHHSWYFRDTVLTYQQITGKPACVTEFGVASSQTIGHVEGFEWADNTTQQQQADWVTEGMSLCKQWGCRLMMLYNLDYGPATRQVDANALYSFIDIGLGRRPVFHAVQDWCAANGCK